VQTQRPTHSTKRSVCSIDRVSSKSPEFLRNLLCLHFLALRSQPSLLGRDSI
jgi:hypothetical protein